MLAGRGGKVQGSSPEPNNIWVPNLDQDSQLKKQFTHFCFDVALTLTRLANFLYSDFGPIVVTSINFSERTFVDLN